MNKYGFVADYSGVITVLKLTESGFTPVTTLKGHTSNPLLLSLSPLISSLYSSFFSL